MSLALWSTLSIISFKGLSTSDNLNNSYLPFLICFNSIPKNKCNYYSKNRGALHGHIFNILFYQYTP